MAGAQAANQQKMHVLYSEHHGWLRSWLQGRLGNASDAADLAHDTFLRVLVAGHWPDTHQPRAYLTRVARNLLIDRHRRSLIQRAYLETLAALPEPLAPSPEAQALALDTLQRIDAMLCGLPPQTRTIFLEAQIEALTYAQIGARHGVSVTTVKRHLHAALVACIGAVEHA